MRQLWKGFSIMSCCALSSMSAHAYGVVTFGSSAAQNTGVSAVWILSNISYAGMRAQGSKSTAWRIIAFLFGFPGTLVTFFAVGNGGKRAYGIELPTSDEK